MGMDKNSNPMNTETLHSAALVAQSKWGVV